MEFDQMLEIVGNEPVFRTGLLLAGDVDQVHIRRQLGRWVKAGKVYQLRRGLYALAPPHQQTKPHPFLVANQLVRPSYVSLQSALAYYGLIPEYVPVTTSVTSDRPQEVSTPLGEYQFKRVRKDRFFAFNLEDLGDGQSAYLAEPEKALLDLVYLRPGGEDLSYLRSLRLQNLEGIDTDKLGEIAQQFYSPKIVRAVENIIQIMGED
jgi:predicted transcriptional regulator of viral defense system